MGFIANMFNKKIVVWDIHGTLMDMCIYVMQYTK